jgi:beta-glucanase (GH16 family)
MTVYRHLPEPMIQKSASNEPLCDQSSPRHGRHAFLSVAMASLAIGVVMTGTALAADAPKQLTLDQPTGAATDKCMPVDSSAVAPLQLKQSFVDNFNGSTLSRDTWETHYPGVDDWVDNRTLHGNSEKEIYVDPEFKGAGINPFVLKDGVLSIVAQKTPPEYLQTFKGLPYTSGLTRESFYQTYGYFEISARMPRGHAYWPAFWMLKRKQDWPPEIDILETGGDKPESVDMTTHWKKDGTGQHLRTHCTVQVPGSDKNFHTYGVLWTKDHIVYYLDRKPVGQFNTPAGLDRPMYLLANLAVQHTANDKTPTPISYDIDWIAAYKF